MKAFIKITISEVAAWDINFKQLSVLKNLFTAYHIYDFDNYSDLITVSYAEKLMEIADEVVLVIEMGSSAHILGNIPKFLRKLLRFRNKIELFYCGSHPLIQKQILPFQPVYIQNLEEVHTILSK